MRSLAAEAGIDWVQFVEADLSELAGAFNATGLPDMDFPGTDYCAIAQGYGVTVVRVSSRDELAAALVRCVASDSPSLIEVFTRTSSQ